LSVGASVCLSLAGSYRKNKMDKKTTNSVNVSLGKLAGVAGVKIFTSNRSSTPYVKKLQKNAVNLA